MFTGYAASNEGEVPLPAKYLLPPKGVRLPEKFQSTAKLCNKFDRSNKISLCYYGQVNSLRLKSGAAS